MSSRRICLGSGCEFFIVSWGFDCGGGWEVIAETHHVVVVLVPLFLAEEGAERADGSGV